MPIENLTDKPQVLPDTAAEWVARAAEKPTFHDALTYLALCEANRAVVQGVRNHGAYDTCFAYLFRELARAWRAQGKTISVDDLANVTLT